MYRCRTMSREFEVDDRPRHKLDTDARKERWLSDLLVMWHRATRILVVSPFVLANRASISVVHNFFGCLYASLTCDDRPASCIRAAAEPKTSISSHYSSVDHGWYHAQYLGEKRSRTALDRHTTTYYRPTRDCARRTWAVRQFSTSTSIS